MAYTTCSTSSNKKHVIFVSVISYNLSCVVRHCHGKSTCCNVTIFHVMRLDENSLEWICVDLVGGEALFLGYGNVVFVTFSQISGSILRRHCIYFFGNRIFNGEKCIFNHGFVGVFCMKS